MLLFNHCCFTSLGVTHNILNLSQFSHSTWKLPLPLGYTCTVPKAYQAPSCITGWSFSYSTTGLEKAMLSCWKEKIRKFSWGEQPCRIFWFKVFQAWVQDISQWFLTFYVYFCVDCVLVTDPLSIQSHTADWVAIIDIYVPGINEQFRVEEVKHFLLEL